MVGITVGVIDGLTSRPNSERLDTGNVVAECVLYVLRAMRVVWHVVAEPETSSSCKKANKYI